jgi:quercetin dioxygenase-like cupin family protein
MKKANIDELKLSDVRPGVTRRSFSGEGATLAWGTLSPGHEPRPHTHPHEQIVYIVSGHGPSVFNPRRDDYYAIDEGDPGA